MDRALKDYQATTEELYQRVPTPPEPELPSTVSFEFLSGAFSL